MSFKITFVALFFVSVPKSVHISLGPITAYVEDKYVMELRKHISALLSPILASWIHSNDPEFLESNSAHTAWIPAPLPVCLELQVSWFDTHCTFVCTCLVHQLHFQWFFKKKKYFFRFFDDLFV